jgi:hypothetical protein
LAEPTQKPRAGFTKAPNVLLMSADISNAELRLWLLLKAYCLNKPQCFPKVATLGSILGLKDRRTRQVVDSLEVKGLLRKVFRRGRTCLLEPLDPAKCGSGMPRSKEKLGNGLPKSDQSAAMDCRGVRQWSADKEDSNEKDNSTSPQASLDVPTDENTTEAKSKPGNRKPRKQKQSSPDPRVNLLKEDFQANYKRRFKGFPYEEDHARDGRIFKDLLAKYSLETLQECIRLFFIDSDSFVNGKRTVPIFRSRVNNYIQAIADSSWNAASEKTAPTCAAHRRLEEQ